MAGVLTLEQIIQAQEMVGREGVSQCRMDTPIGTGDRLGAGVLNDLYDRQEDALPPETFNQRAGQDDGGVTEFGQYRTLRGRERPERSEFAGRDFGAAGPKVVAGQVDVLPSQGREVWQQRRVHRISEGAKGDGRALQIDRVPKHDRRGQQIEAAGAIALLLKAAIPNFSEPVKEHGPGERVPGLALVESGMDAAAKFDVFQPIQNEERALDAAQLTEGNRETVLARVAGDFSDHQRGRYRSLLD